MGYIQSFFVNFWHQNKYRRIENIPMEVELDEREADGPTIEEVVQIQDWLKINKGPFRKVFEMLNQSFHARSNFIGTNPPFPEIISAWPRLFDIDGAIQNDFSSQYPLTSDNLFFKWSPMSAKVFEYGRVMKRAPAKIGIADDVAQAKPDISALFVLPFLIRPKNRRVSQAGSVEAFIKVVSQSDAVQALESTNDIQPHILAVGNKANLEFVEIFVMFSGKGVKCSNILEAVDLAFKSFYIFKIEFPSSCAGAWQFLDQPIYNMKAIRPVLSSVKELIAFVGPD